jgi:hypothetical protein
MSCAAVDQIARAVLYEGYLLYPYRASALKNQQRWNFGVLYPPAWAASQTGSDRSYFQTECLVEGSAQTTLGISVRFLHLLARESSSGEWQEGSERVVTVAHQLMRAPYVQTFDFPAGEEHTDGIVLRKHAIEGRIEVSTVRVTDNALRLSVRVINTSSFQSTDRNESLLRSLASAHAVITVRFGRFVSMLDPPEHLKDAVASCQNVGVWPVLVGDGGTRDTMLASPIILYDYPQIAAESKGDLFDGTEIDEILILRTLTLTDAEKEEVRRTDERARALLDRLESAPSEHLLDLHGRIRTLGFKKGDRVRLRPRKRADIFDTLLEGKIAIIEAVEQDFENNIHFAVVIEEDPGRDFGEMRQIGHRFFFSPEEVERVA